MSADASPLSTAEKLKALRQIQVLLGQEQRPFARASGLSEVCVAALADEKLIEGVFVSDKGPQLDRYRIERILPAGVALLTQAVDFDAPTQIIVLPPKLTVAQHIRRGTGKILWEILKAVIPLVVGFAWGWFAAKYHLKQ